MRVCASRERLGHKKPRLASRMKKHRTNAKSGELQRVFALLVHSKQERGEFRRQYLRVLVSHY